MSDEKWTVSWEGRRDLMPQMDGELVGYRAESGDASLDVNVMIAGLHKRQLGIWDAVKEVFPMLATEMAGQALKSTVPSGESKSPLEVRIQDADLERIGGLLTSPKQCRYRASDLSTMVCGVATDTTKPFADLAICGQCGLPDDRWACSEIRNVRTADTSTFSGRSRLVVSADCTQGQLGRGGVAECIPGQRDCWRIEVEVGKPREFGFSVGS